MQWVETSRGFENDHWIVGPRPSDNELALLYLMLQATGEFGRVFSPEFTVKKWLEWATDPCTHMIGVWSKAGAGADVLCAIGFSNVSYRMGDKTIAEVGFATSPAMPMQSVFVKCALIKKILDFAFARTKVDSIVGWIPVANMAAVAFSRRIGISLFGPVRYTALWQNVACPSYICQIDKETWLNVHSTVLNAA